MENGLVFLLLMMCAPTMGFARLTILNIHDEIG
jgi:hypothetical protein